ncbi:MAG: DUF502 domain-containing protein [Bacteroidia bacterium]
MKKYDFDPQHFNKTLKSPFQRVIGYLLRGLLVLVPIGATVGIVMWILGWLSGLLHLDEVSFLQFCLYAALVLAGIVGVGILTQGVVAKQVLDFFEGIIEKAPGLSFIFGTTKDMTEAFMGENKKFDKPIVVELEGGMHRMGFLTQEDMSIINMPDHCSVYLPLSYALTGEMLIVPKNKVKPIDVEPSHVTKFVVSGGVAGLD